MALKRVAAPITKPEKSTKPAPSNNVEIKVDFRTKEGRLLRALMGKMKGITIHQDAGGHVAVVPHARGAKVVWASPTSIHRNKLDKASPRVPYILGPRHEITKAAAAEKAAKRPQKAAGAARKAKAA